MKSELLGQPKLTNGFRMTDDLSSLRYTPTVHEQSLIAAFVGKTKRDRYREILSNPRLRRKFTSQLAHFKDFDPQFRLPIPSNKLFVESIALELQKRHSPSIVFAIFEDPSLDQKELPLIEALKQIVGRGMGTVLSCIPGHLARFPGAELRSTRSETSGISSRKTESEATSG